MEKKPCMHYGNLAWPDISATLESHLLILPVGSIEQHGIHLPVTVDIVISTEIAKAIANQLDALVAPGITYGARSLPHSGGGSTFPGTIFIRGNVLTEYYSDIIRSYVFAGAKKILVINGHYENEAFLFEAIDLCREAGTLSQTKVIALSWWSVLNESILEQLFSGQFPGWHAEHAGLCETSLMLYLRPDSVGSKRLDNENPPRNGIYQSHINGYDISAEGVLACSSLASSQIGEKLFKMVCYELSQIVNESLL